VRKIGRHFYEDIWGLFCEGIWEAVLWGKLGVCFMRIFGRQLYEDILEAMPWGYFV